MNLQHKAGLTLARRFEAANKMATILAEGPSSETEAADNVRFISLHSSVIML